MKLNKFMFLLSVLLFVVPVILFMINPYDKKLVILIYNNFPLSNLLIFMIANDMEITKWGSGERFFNVIVNKYLLMGIFIITIIMLWGVLHFTLVFSIVLFLMWLFNVLFLIKILNYV